MVKLVANTREIDGLHRQVALGVPLAVAMIALGGLLLRAVADPACRNMRGGQVRRKIGVVCPPPARRERRCETSAAEPAPQASRLTPPYGLVQIAVSKDFLPRRPYIVAATR